MHKKKNYRKKSKGLINASATSFGKKIRKKERIYCIQRGVLASSLGDARMEWFFSCTPQRAQELVACVFENIQVWMCGRVTGRGKENYGGGWGSAG